MKTIVYIDAFNLYYGSLKGTPHKWLDVVQLSKQLVPSTDVTPVSHPAITRVLW